MSSTGSGVLRPGQTFPQVVLFVCFRHLIYCLWDIILELLELSASAEESAVTSSTADTPGRRASPLSQRPLSHFFEG